MPTASASSDDTWRYGTVRGKQEHAGFRRTTQQPFSRIPSGQFTQSLAPSSSPNHPHDLQDAHTCKGHVHDHKPRLSRPHTTKMISPAPSDNYPHASQAPDDHRAKLPTPDNHQVASIFSSNPSPSTCPRCSSTYHTLSIKRKRTHHLLHARCYRLHPPSIIALATHAPS